MARAKVERNRGILRLRLEGLRPSEIATQHNLTRARVTQIIAATGAVEKRKVALAKRYGDRPDIARLEDATPLDVLMLHQSTIYGWIARIQSLCKGQEPLKTLGDLRRLSDVELLARPGVGAQLFAELRAICPHARAPKMRSPRAGRSINKHRSPAALAPFFK